MMGQDVWIVLKSEIKRNYCTKQLIHELILIITSLFLMCFEIVPT